MLPMRMGPSSDSSIVIYLGDAISLDVHRHVAALFLQLLALPAAGIRNLHPAYRSISIDYDPLQLSIEELYEHVNRAADRVEHSDLPPSRTVEIPVCYDVEFALDHAEVSRHAGLPFSEIVAAHSGAEYFVYFLGFAPGFAYMGGLDSRLQVPRLSSPRKQVVAGSVGLAGAQTGVYPNDSPGGWQIIGRTPLRMFDAARSKPSLLETGDRVRFVPIEPAEFDRLVATERPR